MSIKIDSGSVNMTISSLGNLTNLLKNELTKVTEIVALKMETWARQNVPWQNQTGQARRELKASVDWETAEKLVVSMAHIVDYGVWLELAHNRKYAILEEAIEEYKDEFIAEWRKLVS